MSRFGEEVHEVHSASLHEVHHLIDARYEVIVGKKRDDTDNETGNSCNKGGVDNSGQLND